MATIEPQLNWSRVDLAEVVPLAAPYVIYIEPSSFCNLECKFCPQHIAPEYINKTNMSVDTFLKVIEDLRAFSSKPKLMRFCALGDPLFNKNFIKMVSAAADSQVVEKIEVITNGALITDEIAETLPLLVDRIIISIEGLSEGDYLSFTNRKIDFDKLVEKIRRLTASRDRKAIIHTKIHNSAVQTDELKKSFYSIFSSIADEVYIENLVDLWPEVKSNLGLDVGHRFDGRKPEKIDVCPQIFKSMQVNADGRVIPCCIDWKTINQIGHVENESLESIWNGAKLKDLRLKHLRGERHSFSPCKGCTMNELSDLDNLDKNKHELLEKLEANDRK